MLPGEVEALLPSSGTVVFDADGTLWRGDVGDELVRDLGHFDEYQRRVHADPIAGYTWAAEILFGLEEAEVLERCTRLFARQEVFGFVRPLLQRLEGAQVFIVSASPRWAVLPGAAALGIAPERVIAVDAPVSGGRIGRVRTPIPCGEGKVHHLETLGLEPVLAFGNGDLDAPMLRHARAAVVVAPHGGPDNHLVQLAVARRWPILRG
ncbi:MAG: haloacid dehalogenase-like hydrolase [Archangiaceae bacterium]|nr:haloacid dehalogenase-like hydrolase [Archangiaceae bacterium]